MKRIGLIVMLVAIIGGGFALLRQRGKQNN